MGIEDGWEISCSIGPLAESAGPVPIPYNRIHEPGIPPLTSLAYRLSLYHDQRIVGLVDALFRYNVLVSFTYEVCVKPRPVLIMPYGLI